MGMCRFVSYMSVNNRFGPILDDRLKEQILKPWKGAHSSLSVCLSVNKLQCTPFDLGIDFWVNCGKYIDKEGKNPETLKGCPQ